MNTAEEIGGGGGGGGWTGETLPLRISKSSFTPDFINSNIPICVPYEQRRFCSECMNA